MGRASLIGAAGLLAALGFATTANATLSITPVGRVTLAGGPNNAVELSGITWAGGNQYYAVSDEGGRLYPISVSLNLTTGAITSATTGARVQLAAGADVEGIVYNASSGTIYASDETGPAIREYNPSTGAVLGTVTVPAIYNNIRGNYSLESLSRTATTLWTANEEALSVDGSLSTTSAGSWVRIQRFGAGNTPNGQWAYQTDSISALTSLTDRERSGVSDLLALPDGRLLVLEREFGGSGIPDYRTRIYEVNFAGASDTSAVASLNGGGFTAVGKTLLLEMNFAVGELNNFEGMTFGPQLANGDQSVLLVSDDNGADGLHQQSLYALRISGVPEPTACSLFVAGMAATVLQRRRRRGA